MGKVSSKTGIENVSEAAINPAKEDGNLATLAGCVDGSEIQVDIVSGGSSGTEYDEDTAHSTGDKGKQVLAVRNDTLASLVDTDGDYAPLQVNASGALYVEESNSADIKTAVETIDNAISGSEMQVDVVTMPTTTVTDDGNFTLAANDGVDIGDVGISNVIATVSTNNSTTSTLGSGGVFTGTGEDIHNYASIKVSVFADQDSATDGLQLQFSSDGSNWDISYDFDVTANQAFVAEVGPEAQYFRVVYTNGGSAQGAFRLQTTYYPVVTEKLGVPVESTVDPGDNAQLVRSILVAKDPGGNYGNINRTNGGNLKTSIEEFAGSLPAGTNNIGDVDIASALPAGSNLIGNVKISDGTETANVNASNQLLVSVENTPTVDLGANNDVTIDGSSIVKAEDAAHSTGDDGVMSLAVRNDTLATLVDTDGDYAPLQVNASGALYVKQDGDVNIADGGNTITVDGSVNATLQASDGTDIGNVDVASIAAGSNIIGKTYLTDGTEDAAVNASNELQVRDDDANTDLDTIAGAVSGSEMQVDVVASLPAGTNNIGDVDIASAIPAGTNIIGVVDNIPTDYELAGNTEHVTKYYTNAGAVTDGIVWSPAAGKRWYVTDLIINVSAAATVTLEDDQAGGDTAVFKAELAANSGISHSFNTPLFSGEDAADLVVTTSAGNVYITVTGYEV